MPSLGRHFSGADFAASCAGAGIVAFIRPAKTKIDNRSKRFRRFVTDVFSRIKAQSPRSQGDRAQGEQYPIAHKLSKLALADRRVAAVAHNSR